MLSPTTAALLLAALGLVPAVAAHGIVTKVAIGDETYGSISLNQPPSRLRWPQPGNNDFGFVDGSSYSTPDIICHKGATPGSIHAPIAAGSDIKFFWNKWPGPYHKGPVIDYLANCEGPCETVDKTKLKWVKIFEQGLLQAGTSPDRSLPRFAADQLRDDGAAHTARIPEDLAAGNYTFRHEIIALHMANKRNGAQNYPSCFNLEITGDGEARPSGVLGTELYKVDDPGLLLNIFTKDFTSYVIPGPTLYRGGAASSMPTQSLSSSKAAAITKATPSASSGGRSGSSGPKVTQPASSYPLDYGQPQTHETDSAEVSMVDKYATSSASAPDECYGRATTTVTVTVTAELSHYQAGPCGTGKLSALGRGYSTPATTSCSSTSTGFVSMPYHSRYY